jgi:two-component system, OmpR family, sensor kinase
LQVEELKGSLSEAGNFPVFARMQMGLSRMSALLGQLLKLARADAPRNAAGNETADLNAAVRAALADAFTMATAKTIDLGIEKEAFVRVKGEQMDLVMLVGNLIENAVRYTPTGGKIDIEISILGDDALVAIKDSGPGLPESALARVFERFYRYAPQDTEGSGLGLSIAAALAARCGAEVSLENRKDRTGLIATVKFKAADA